jgi:hypothetical protein
VEHFSYEMNSCFFRALQPVRNFSFEIHIEKMYVIVYIIDHPSVHLALVTGTRLNEITLQTIIN